MAETTSLISTITAPSLTGVWVFDPMDAEGTESAWPYAEGRTEDIDAQGVEILLAGREAPVMEFSDHTLVGLSLTVMIPFSDTHDQDVEWWRAAIRNRRTLCYRDNRGRLMYAGILGAPAIADGRAGTALSIKLRQVDYTAVV